MHDAQRVVTLGDRVDEDADREKVVDLVERLRLLGVADHLLVDAGDVFRATGDLGLDAGGIQMRSAKCQTLRE